MKAQTNRLLVVVIAMQAMLLAGQWLNGSLGNSAQRGPDGGRTTAADHRRAEINNPEAEIAHRLDSGERQAAGAHRAGGCEAPIAAGFASVEIP